MWDVDHQRLPMWVVYDNPADYPGRTLARLWYTIPAREATKTVLVGNMPTIRAALSSHGYTRIERHPSDDACIVETWL